MLKVLAKPEIQQIEKSHSESELQLLEGGNYTCYIENHATSWQGPTEIM